MLNDRDMLQALIAYWGSDIKRAEFEEIRQINAREMIPAIDIGLAEFIEENAGLEYDSGSDDDNAACDQIERLASRAAAYIIGEWAMRDIFGPHYDIDDLRQALDYGNFESAANAREMQYAQLIIALVALRGPGDISNFMNNQALESMRAELIAGKLDAWIYNSDWDL